MAIEQYEKDVITVQQSNPASSPRYRRIATKPQAAGIARPAEFTTSPPASVVSQGSSFS
jgi:hypothetical protein